MLHKCSHNTEIPLTTVSNTPNLSQPISYNYFLCSLERLRLQQFIEQVAVFESANVYIVYLENDVAFTAHNYLVLR